MLLNMFYSFQACPLPYRPTFVRSLHIIHTAHFFAWKQIVKLRRHIVIKARYALPTRTARTYGPYVWPYVRVVRTGSVYQAKKLIVKIIIVVNPISSIIAWAGTTRPHATLSNFFLIRTQNGFIMLSIEQNVMFHYCYKLFFVFVI